VDAGWPALRYNRPHACRPSRNTHAHDLDPYHQTQPANEEGSWGEAAAAPLGSLGSSLLLFRNKREGCCAAFLLIVGPFGVVLTYPPASQQQQQQQLTAQP
jgi:hypothetical protein